MSFTCARCTAGADLGRIEQFIASLRAGANVPAVLEQARVPEPVRDFVRHTFSVLARGQLHEIAAVFTYGREDLIPDMFGELVAQLDRDLPGKLTTFRYYLERHIELDGDKHGAMGCEMVDVLCAGDARRMTEAQAAAVRALQSRVKLWDGIGECAAATTNCFTTIHYEFELEAAGSRPLPISPRRLLLRRSSRSRLSGHRRKACGSCRRRRGSSQLRRNRRPCRA